MFFEQEPGTKEAEVEQGPGEEAAQGLQTNRENIC